MPIEYEGVRIYHCGGCGGHWMSPERLDVILGRRELVMPEPVKQRMWSIADSNDSAEVLWCFGCGTEMVKESFLYWDEIRVDRCPKCRGLWLDRGELELCQIFWEYAQDNPDQWSGADAIARKAELNARARMQQDALRSAVSSKDTSGMLSFFARML
jgi:Zn-finger nucleic acid-binding protein